MLQPKRTKFRKAFKGRIHGDAKGGSTLTYGSIGLKAMAPERITARQIEAARRAITRQHRVLDRRQGLPPVDSYEVALFHRPSADALVQVLATELGRLVEARPRG